ncbi:unnamed protein product [Penicillium manginii]
MLPLRSAILRPAPRDVLLCSCLGRSGTQSSSVRRFWSSSHRRTGIAENQASSLLQKTYFSRNSLYDGTGLKGGFISSFASLNSDQPGQSSTSQPTNQPSANPAGSTETVTSESIATQNTPDELPHRRRKRLRDEGSENGQAEPVIPPDASAQLSNLSSTLPTTSLRRKLAAYFALTKPRLSFLIVLSTTSAYGMYPISSLLALDPAMTPLPTLSTSTLTFIYLTAVRGLVSRRGALLFAVATAATGLGLLYIGTNPTTTALSAANIFLYAFVYTPLKRISVINTWVGAVVGGIPPLMGWVAAAGQTATTGHDTWRDMLFSEDSIGGWLLGAILFAWQFPHFNALSHTIREEYKGAGYRMLAWVNPAQNARVALRYSIFMFPISIGLWWVGVVGHGFLVGSTFANGWLVREAYGFWKHQGAQGTARGLFWASIWQLPILLVGGLVTKKGLWDGVWRNIFGQPEEDDDEYVYYDDEEEEGAVEAGDKPRSTSSRESALSTA